MADKVDATILRRVSQVSRVDIYLELHDAEPDRPIPMDRADMIQNTLCCCSASYYAMMPVIGLEKNPAGEVIHLVPMLRI